MSDSLKIIVAELMGIAPDQLGADRALAGARLQGSLGRSILDAAMRRRLGIQSPACYTAKTYGELESAVSGNAIAVVTNGAAKAAIVAAADPAPTPSQKRVSYDSQLSSIGIDIELIDSLPATRDFWTHEFYTTHFTSGEIAYCLTQQSPPQHFAARWCAKEALKKCEPALLTEQMRNLEVVSLPDGSPMLKHHVNGIARDLPHALSMTHTSHAAAAVVIRIQSPPPPPPPAPVAPMVLPAPKQSKKLALLTLAFSFLAMAFAAAALVIAIRHHH
jgi:phosphopantetheine--protein transferase-like protein